MVEVDGKQVEDYRLSRFACYLTAMNGDVKKKQVAKAQAYFAAIAESFRQCLEDADNIERLAVREEVSDRERSFGRRCKILRCYDVPILPKCRLSWHV